MIVPEFKLDENFSAKRQMGVRNRPEDGFKKKIVIPFLKSIEFGFVLPFNYISKFYSTDPGIPDIFFFYPGLNFAIETKAKNGRLSDDQKRQRKKLELSGVTYVPLWPEDFEAFKAMMLARCRQ